MTTASIRTIGSRLLENESPELHADFKEDRSFCEAQHECIREPFQVTDGYSFHLLVG